MQLLVFNMMSQRLMEYNDYTSLFDISWFSYLFFRLVSNLFIILILFYFLTYELIHIFFDLIYFFTSIIFILYIHYFFVLFPCFFAYLTSKYLFTYLYISCVMRDMFPITLSFGPWKILISFHDMIEFWFWLRIWLKFVICQPATTELLFYETSFKFSNYYLIYYMLRYVKCEMIYNFGYTHCKITMHVSFSEFILISLKMFLLTNKNSNQNILGKTLFLRFFLRFFFIFLYRNRSLEVLKILGKCSMKNIFWTLLQNSQKNNLQWSSILSRIADSVSCCLSWITLDCKITRENIKQIINRTNSS